MSILHLVSQYIFAWERGVKLPYLCPGRGIGGGREKHFFFFIFFCLLFLL